MATAKEQNFMCYLLVSKNPQCKGETYIGYVLMENLNIHLWLQCYVVANLSVLL